MNQIFTETFIKKFGERNMFKGCMACKHFSDVYSIRSDIYGQCNYMPDKNDKIPIPFSRQPIYVGTTIGGAPRFNDNGYDCPCWVAKSSDVNFSPTPLSTAMSAKHVKAQE